MPARGGDWERNVYNCQAFWILNLGTSHLNGLNSKNDLLYIYWGSNCVCCCLLHWNNITWHFLMGLFSWSKSWYGLKRVSILTMCTDGLPLFSFKTDKIKKWFYWRVLDLHFTQSILNTASRHVSMYTWKPNCSYAGTRFTWELYLASGSEHFSF